MSNQNQHHKDIFQLERIALFSDAVFAIAITLLIIEIKVPELPSVNPAFSHEFGRAMNEMFPEFIGFIISFTVIGNYWRAHHTMFNFVADYDRKLIQLNSLFLLTIVIMPFTTNFMSTYMLFQPFFYLLPERNYFRLFADQDMATYYQGIQSPAHCAAGRYEIL